MTTEEGGSLLFFRVRDQGNLVVSLGPLARREEPFTLTTRYSGRHDPAPVDQELVQVTAPTASTSPTRRFVDRPPLVYSNRTAWYPRPPSEDFATRAGGARRARGLAGGDGRRARLAPHRGRPHARRVPPRAARQVRHRDRGPARRRGPAAGGRAGRARLRRPAHARRDPRPDAGRPGDAGLLRGEVRPVALPDPRPRGGGGRDARRPQPAGPRLPAGAPAGPARALAPRRPLELQRPRPASSWPTRRPTSGGARAPPPRTTASAGSPRRGPSTPPRSGCASGSGRGPSAA